MQLYAEENFSGERKQMLNSIREMVKDTRGHTGINELKDSVYNAIDAVPRHEFIPIERRIYAYENRPLPIGENQTISQPYIVALMTDLLDVDKDSVVLEVGTGSGYQAAILAKLVKHVYTIEIIEKLGEKARVTLNRLDYDNVTVRIGDGYHGWPEHAPFDAIIVTAAPEQVPQPLIDQLKQGGKMVVPVGEIHGPQLLKVLEKKISGEIETENVLSVAFVPLTGDH